MGAQTGKPLSVLVSVNPSYFPVFGLNAGKYGPEITPYLDSFHAVFSFEITETIVQLLFIVQLFVETSCSFKITKTTVCIGPFKTNYVKMKTIFSLKKTIKVTFL